MSNAGNFFSVGPGRLAAVDLLPLEQYATVRDQFRQEVVAHKKARRLALGSHVSLLFEDRMTMQYQVQEMLRIERIFEADGVAEELSAYNPLIPDGSNWKATMLIEYPDVAERREALASLVGIEHRVWMRVSGHDLVRAIADEDLDRSNDDKTSAVHFLRFELTPGMVADLKNGATLAAGIDHDAYRQQCDPVPDDLKASLLCDLS